MFVLISMHCSYCYRQLTSQNMNCHDIKQERKNHELVKQHEENCFYNPVNKHCFSCINLIDTRGCSLDISHEKYCNFQMGDKKCLDWKGK